MRLYNANSGVEFDAWFESNPGVPTIPPSVQWRLRCVTNDETAVDWTTVPVTINSDESGITGVFARIDVPGSANAILNRANRREIKELQVVSGKDGDREFSAAYQYGIVPMSGR